MFVSSGASLSQVEHKVRDQVVSIDANWIGCVLPVMGYPVTGTISLITALDWIGWIGCFLSVGNCLGETHGRNLILRAHIEITNIIFVPALFSIFRHHERI